MDCFRVLMLVFFTCTLFLVDSFYSVDGRISTLSNEDNLKMGGEPRYLNKPGLKTIKTEYGDIYDCVDIHKQPALDHPLLKGHKIQMTPNFAPETILQPTSTSTSANKGLKDGCPAGTVPIKRANEEELLRAQSSFREHFDVSAGSGFEFAGMSTIYKNNTKYDGGGGYISIYNPIADPGQFTASAISIEDGPMDQFSTIRVGWMVNPSLYGDTHTRLYTIWGQGVNGTMHGCYNTYCPGFILLSSTTPLDLVLSNLSIAGGQQSYVKLTVVQDKPIGNWYLLYSQNDGEDEKIGYWPISLFTSFKDGGAEFIRWGGMVYSGTPQSPPMGSGGNDCHFKRVMLSGGNIGEPLEKSESRCYRVGDNPYAGGPYWGYSFWFGGQGGDTHHCH